MLRYNPQGNLREIVLSMAKILEQHDELLEKIAEFFTVNRPTLEEIISCVAEFYLIERSDLIGHSKLEKFRYPRLVVYYLARKLTRLSLPQIAAKMDDRDHTTVYKGFMSVAHTVRKDELLRDDLDVLRSRIAEKVLARTPEHRWLSS